MLPRKERCQLLYPRRLVTIDRSFFILWTVMVHASHVFNGVFGLKIQFIRHGLVQRPFV